ncbi:hypothetical protein GCM10027586_02220 [Kineococcus gypseus]|uniref:hypothetical protein n=1 Tax=Kineococcus gypseus TaxID=1637102 RepID=UPI003D7DD7EA
MVSRFRTRKALGISAASLATMTLVPLLAPAGRTERLTLLVAAVPLALLFGAIAGWTPPATPPPPTHAAAPVSSAAHPGARTALDVDTDTHLHAPERTRVPGVNFGAQPRAVRPGQAPVGLGTVEEPQHTLLR